MNGGGTVKTTWFLAVPFFNNSNKKTTHGRDDKC